MSALRIFGRVSRATLIAVLVAVLVAVGGGIAVYFVYFHKDTYRITARFTATPGLYVGNTVDILGVPTGTVVSIKPTPRYVEVGLSIPTDVRIPGGAKAVLMAPNPVSDRYVELTPAYTRGPVMKPGAIIDLNNTIVPLELDSIYNSVDNLSKSLGPGGANAHGDLSALLHSLAQLANGNGRDLHATIEEIAAALPALTTHPDDLRNLVDGLDQLTSQLAAHNSTINSLYDDLTTATGQLADERQVLGAAITNLQQGLAQVADFLRANQNQLSGSVQNLDATIAAVIHEQKALIQTFDTAPLGFQNFNRAIDPNSPCLSPTGAPDNCSALWSRVDFPANAAQIVKTYCGTVKDSLIPIILNNLHLASATATHTDCGAQVGLAQGRTGAPGAPMVDFDITDYLVSR